MASLGDNEITIKQIYCLWGPLQDAFAGSDPYFDIFAAFLDKKLPEMSP